MDGADQHNDGSDFSVLSVTIEDPLTALDDLVAKAKKSTFEVEFPLKFKFLQMP